MSRKPRTPQEMMTENGWVPYWSDKELDVPCTVNEVYDYQNDRELETSLRLIGRCEFSEVVQLNEVFGWRTAYGPDLFWYKAVAE